VWGHGFSEAATRKSFLDPNSGVVDPNSGVAVFSEAVTRMFFRGPDSGNSNILLLFKCTNKRTCRDMQDR
jgi:hypothetical protein